MIAALQSHQLGNPDAVVDSAILGVVSEMHALMRKITTFNQGTVGDFNTKATLLAQGLNGDLIRLNQKTPSPATPAPITRGRAVGK